MPAELEMEDEELYETGDEAEDEEAEDQDAEDEESAIAMYRPFMRPFVPPVPFVAGRLPGFQPGADRRRLRGVKAGVIRGRDGATAIVRLPTAVATATGLRTLGRRSRQAEAVLAHHDLGLRTLRAGESRVRTFIASAVILQHLRDVVAEARAAVRPSGWPALWHPILAGMDYTLATTQTAFSVAAIPASRRSTLFWTLPLTTGLIASLGREALREPVGFNVGPHGAVAGAPATRGKEWPDSMVAVAIPALVGAAAAYLVRPGSAGRLLRA